MTLNISVVAQDSRDWDAARQLVHDRYRRQFTANWNGTPDLFVAASDGDELVAVVGLTRASSGPLFVERYLPDPIEVQVGSHFGTKVMRQKVFEAGPAASRGSRAGADVIRVVPVVAWLMGATYLAVTSTPDVERLLRTVGWDYSTIAAADPRCLTAAERAAWGSYYESGPQVGLSETSACTGCFRQWHEKYRLEFVGDLLVSAQGGDRDHAVLAR